MNLFVLQSLLNVPQTTVGHSLGYKYQPLHCMHDRVYNVEFKWYSNPAVLEFYDNNVDNLTIEESTLHSLAEIKFFRIIIS